MNDELKELVLNENVPMSLIEEFSGKMKALTAKAEKLNSAIREARSIGDKFGLAGQMFQLHGKAERVKEDFIKEARKYVKKGGAGDEEK